MHRRGFVKATTAATGAWWLRAVPLWGAADCEVEISPDRPGAIIQPCNYGHFIEHLGGVIYDGVWVGRDSKIENVDGIRRRFIDDMRRIGAPCLRWPGGCFADGYHWRDGIGPPRARPRTYNFWETRMPNGLHATESNQFGVHEFIHLCRLLGAEPYLAANLGSGTPREFHDWVSYCNAPPGTESLAEERAANGDKEPFRVRYWGVGNEAWGCGGDMTPEQYAAEYRKFVTQFPIYLSPFLIATGPRGHARDMDLSWTKGFFEAMQGGHRSEVNGFSLHFYSDFRNRKTRVADFKPADWYAVLLEALRTESVIDAHWSLMGEYDPEHRSKLVIDEWGVWYRPGEEIGPKYILSQPVTLRDALHTAITLDIFNRHAEAIAMANVAQTVNCIHSLFLAEEANFTRTPPYYVFEMYRPHLGARSVPVTIQANDLRVPVDDGIAKMPALIGSASVHEKNLTVTLTNPSLDSSMAARIHLTGSMHAAEATAQVLTHSDMKARNTFENPEEVKPLKLSVRINQESVRIDVPKQAVVALYIILA
ncbi:MAG: alpha-N-arabinofuranosidase [Acidobacteria bacterium]|nr:alpha-N-arabinofuranosidase [Acidobacteriota bacterium]